MSISCTANSVIPAIARKARWRIVPTLELDDGTLITQSLAIIDYLDALKPEPPLLPRDAVLAAQARAAALTIACEIHPLANLRVIEALQRQFGAKGRSDRRVAQALDCRGSDSGRGAHRAWPFRLWRRAVAC